MGQFDVSSLDRAANQFLSLVWVAVIHIVHRVVHETDNGAIFQISARHSLYKLQKSAYMRFCGLILLFFGLGVFSVTGSPSTDIDRSLDKNLAIKLSENVAKQLHKPRVDVLQSFKFKSWTILYVNTHDADETFLFYRSDPNTNQPVTFWNGAARTDEGDEIKEWVLKNATGIPLEFAEYFAWYVTKGRKM